LKVVAWNHAIALGRFENSDLAMIKIKEKYFIVNRKK